MNQSYEDNPVGSEGFRPRNRREARFAMPLPTPDYAPSVLNEDGTISSATQPAHPLPDAPGFRDGPPSSDPSTRGADAPGFRDDSSFLGIPQPTEMRSGVAPLPEGSRSDRLEGLRPEGSRSDRLEGSPVGFTPVPATQTFASFADIIAGNSNPPASEPAESTASTRDTPERAESDSSDFSFEIFEALAADTAEVPVVPAADAEAPVAQATEQSEMATPAHFAEAVQALALSQASAQRQATDQPAARAAAPSNAVWSLDDASNEPFAFPPVEVAPVAEDVTPTAVYDLGNFSQTQLPDLKAAAVFGDDLQHAHAADESAADDDDDPFQVNAGDVEQADGSLADPDLLEALRQVLVLGASDLHVTVGAPPNIRIHGGLQALDGQRKWMRDKVTSALYSLLTPAQKERFEEALELDFAYSTAGARFRVNYYLQRNSIGAAFRLIPREIKQLKALGVPDSVSRFAELARGLVLVTGPTGSGKSTTLAALVDLVNRTRADHIVTVEDPIEFLHSHQKSLVNQREVGHDTHSFAAALKHVLRQDPDVILIGELRDLETISVALTAAETGHLVFATLHTQDAASTIDRVIDVFPPHQQGQVRTQLASTLRGVVCQTLVKTANGRGRAVATEVLVTTPAISNLIREGKTYQIPSALQAGRQLGMHSMDQHLAELVDAGKITHAAAIDKAHDLEGLKRLIKRVDTGESTSSQMSAAAGLDYDAHAGTGR